MHFRAFFRKNCINIYLIANFLKKCSILHRFREMVDAQFSEKGSVFIASKRMAVRGVFSEIIEPLSEELNSLGVCKICGEDQTIIRAAELSESANYLTTRMRCIHVDVLSCYPVNLITH